MTAAPAPADPAAADAFAHLLSHGRPMVTLDELAAAIGCSRKKARSLADAGEVEVHDFGCGEGRATTARHAHAYRITRRSVLLYLLRTADYEPADLADRLVAIGKALPSAELAPVIRALHAEWQRRQG